MQRRRRLAPSSSVSIKARPDARYELNYENPFQLLVATILAAQATDERINQVTPALFAKYPDAAAFAQAERSELEQDLKPTGFYRNKAKAVQECCQALSSVSAARCRRTWKTSSRCRASLARRPMWC